jgi:rubrerythrin
MPLENFGSILNFAENLECQDLEFYEVVAANPACEAYKSVFQELAVDVKKNVKTVQRARRENVTEMILEPIKDFKRDRFCEACQGAESMTAAEVLETAHRLETRAESYYSEAAEKIKALPEVARTLKRLGKKRRAHIEKLKAL